MARIGFYAQAESLQQILTSGGDQGQRYRETWNGKASASGAINVTPSAVLRIIQVTRIATEIIWV
jgi:hypothetical protein